MPRYILSISRLVSNFFSPIVSLLLYFFYHSCNSGNWETSIKEFLPILFIIVIPISGWIYWNVRRGNYTDLDVSDRMQRNSLYIFIAVVMVVYLLFSYFINGHLDFRILFLFLLLITMQISNFFIKSSMHTALNVYAAALFFAESPMLGLAWFFIAAIVGISRIILKRHTIKEVLMGSFLATIFSFIYIFTTLQNL
ncbi:MAG: ABC transporter permease [Cruoricaptor ignavus]|nr:ABC transporter permease [Cruoricaptor ignavus]